MMQRYDKKPKFHVQMQRYDKKPEQMLLFIQLVIHIIHRSLIWCYDFS